MHLFNKPKPNIDAVYSQYGDMLYRLALTRLGNDADAQDVVQDVFVKYISAKPVFESCNHEKAWFLRATVNRCYDLARRQKLRAFVPLDEAYGLAADSQEGYRDLMALVAQLPPIYKDVVILHALEGFTLEETADILDISLSAAKMRLSRAKNILQILREEENDVY